MIAIWPTANYITIYRISSYSFRGKYSFLDLEIRPKITVHKCAETIQGRKLSNGGNYMRKYGMWICKRFSEKCSYSAQRMMSEKCVENGCVWPFLPSVLYDWSFLCSVLEDNILEKLTQMRAFANPVFKCVQGLPSQRFFFKTLRLWN